MELEFHLPVSFISGINLKEIQLYGRETAPLTLVVKHQNTEN